MKRRGRLSAGTIIMLLLTAAVVVGCAAFMLVLSGGANGSRSGELLAHVSAYAAQTTPQPSAAPTAVPAASPAPSPSAGATAQPTPVPEKTTVTLAAAGTVYAPKAVRQSVQMGADQFDFTPVFSALTDTLSAADLAIATLETTTAGSDKGYGNYNTPPQILDALRACGIDLISLATERALDKGYDGLSITVGELTSRGLFQVGADPDGTGSGATMVRVGGVQIAVLAYSYGLSDEGSSKTDGDSRGVLAMLDVQRMTEDIARARMDGANLVVVLPHWGTKNKQTTPESVRAMAKTLAQAGADVIFGTHPNVAQGIERITTTRSDGLDYDTIVCYSLGSLLTDSRAEENTAGMIVTLEATYDPATRRVTLGEPQVTPVYIARTRQDDENVYRVVPANDEEALAPLEESERSAAARAAEIVEAIHETEENR